MSILDKLIEKQTWEEFLDYKLNKDLLSSFEIDSIKDYIAEERYLPIATEIVNGRYKFSIPKKHLINKIDKQKKRIIYTYTEDESMILKLLNYLLYKYDDTFLPNCYSFRKNIGVKQAIKDLTGNKNISNMYCYKIDISNYFNSVPIEKLLPKLKELISDDYKLYQLLEDILIDTKVDFKDEILIENKGIMPGVPISSFLANVYLNDVDKYYYENDIIYARYSDDIIMFGDKDDISNIVSKITEQITDHGLNLNEDKLALINPSECWEFLGFSYKAGKIDLSLITKNKIKGKIRRAARKIRRWMIRKEANHERALKVMNKKFNQKFYGYNNEKEFTWSKWFFPLINTDEGLKEVDSYMQQYLRYIVTGKHNKKNYEAADYSYLKKCNYKPLVSEYYKFKKGILIDKV